MTLPSEIPDEAVEAAARAMNPRAWGPQVWTFMAHGETPTAARDRVQRESLETVRAALEAAAPHLMAAILEDCADTAETDELTTAAEVIYDLRRHAKDLKPNASR